MEISQVYKMFLEANRVVIDSRKIQKNDFFVAIKGENFDANTFAKQALDSGALCVIIDNAEFYVDSRTIVVDDSIFFLQRLASYHREQLNLPIIALTGSNGKTTTKELINVVLSEKYKTKATVGNLNNHIGVPLTLLSFDKATEVGIVEMGANHKKEIELLCSIAKPNYGYVTNFGKAHLDGFGGVEGVIQGKAELYDYLRTEERLKLSVNTFINLDDIIQIDKTKGLKKFSFSFIDKNADLYLELIEVSPFVKISFEEVAVKTNLIGSYNVPNIAAAIAIGKYFEVSNIQIKAAIENYVPTNNRSQLLEKNSNQVILDAYNANPSSMKAAIDNFLKLPKQPKIMILGDMFELGNESLNEHKAIVYELKDYPNIKVFLVGNNFYAHRMKIPNIEFFESFQQLKVYLESKKIEKHNILIKGSRAMALERVLELL